MISSERDRLEREMEGERVRRKGRIERTRAGWGGEFELEDKRERRAEGGTAKCRYGTEGGPT